MRDISDLMSLKGKRALITGAVGGLGQEIALTIAELGGDLLLVDLPNTDYTTVTQKVLDSCNVQVECVDCDLENEVERNSLISKVNTDSKGLNILINNAAFVGTSGLEGWVTDFESQSVDTWRRAIEVNLTAVFHLSQGLAPLLKKSAGGSIINIASIFGVVSKENRAAYSSTKWGLIGFTKAVALDLASFNVQVNAVSPGFVDTDLTRKIVGLNNIKQLAETIPQGRLATPDEIAKVVLFLCSDQNTYITGQNIVVDGGFTCA